MIKYCPNGNCLYVWLDGWLAGIESGHWHIAKLQRKLKFLFFSQLHLELLIRLLIETSNFFHHNRIQLLNK